MSTVSINNIPYIYSTTNSNMDSTMHYDMESESIENDLIINEIAEIEEDFCDIEKRSNEYYIGSTILQPEFDTILLGIAISRGSFFKYNANLVQQYFSEYSCIQYSKLPDIHIIKLYISPIGEYVSILKTWWIKWIQRAWKKRFADNKKIIRLRGGIFARKQVELTGKYPIHLRNIPGLRGLLYKEKSLL